MNTQDMFGQTLESIYLGQALSVYNQLLKNHPDISKAFPEFRQLSNGGASIYFYMQRAAIFGFLKSKGLYIEIDADSIDNPESLHLPFDLKKSPAAYRFFLSDSSDNSALLQLLHKISLDKFYTANVEQFGCCNDFIRCSDALACLHADNWDYIGCAYRKNLESGRIFYGKNKNI